MYFCDAQMGDDMSSDEIFAAQMWPWPDPMLKRDSQGQILFVNAAFLRIYGGQVQDWHGNSVAGWPRPAGGATPNRFETRLPSPEGESVFDWVEYTLADGGTLGIARDVTELLPTPEPDPAQSMPDYAAQTQEASYAQPPLQETYAQAAPPHNPAPHEAPAYVSEPANAPAQTTVEHVPVEQDVPAQATVPPTFEVPTFEADAVEIPTVDIPKFETPSYEAPDYAAPETQLATETDSSEPALITPEKVLATPATPLQPTDRDFERRALPIENEDSVLGTNWRDAVIAKAVGNALPTTEDAAPEEEAPAPVLTQKSEGPLRILLAEDNAINALLTRTLLEADGCDVDVVEDGALAVEAMKNQSYDMIFMDMRMPNMDGLESTRKIRALPNVPKSLPIVALTANAFDDDRNACFDSGMNDFMTKPVSAEELADMVNQWARKGQEEAA